MVTNQVFVDKILLRSKDLFKFRDFIKFYPGRELADDKALMFRTHNIFMDYLCNNVLWTDEYYFICQRRHEVSFVFKEESIGYNMDDSGKFKLTEYNDLGVDDSKIHEPIDKEELAKELRFLFGKLSVKSQGQKKCG